jgi:hypothetical protein
VQAIRAALEVTIAKARVIARDVAHVKRAAARPPNAKRYDERLTTARIARTL